MGCVQLIASLGKSLPVEEWVPLVTKAVPLSYHRSSQVCTAGFSNSPSHNTGVPVPQAKWTQLLLRCCSDSYRHQVCRRSPFVPLLLVPLLQRILPSQLTQSQIVMRSQPLYIRKHAQQTPMGYAVLLGFSKYHIDQNRLLSRL